MAIRKNEEGEWFDVNTVSSCKELSEKRAQENSSTFFDKANPVMRIAAINIIETEETV